MAYRRIIHPGFAQAPSLKRVLDGGFTQIGAFRPVRPGGWADAGSLTPLPPSLAPILSVSADVGTFIALLTWTASNRTGSPGFTYEVYMQLNGGGFNLIHSTTATFYNYDAGSTAGDYEFRVLPVNDQGGTAVSNVVSIALPESSDSRLLLNQGGNLLLNAGGTLLING